MKKVFKSLIVSCVILVCLVITACSTKEFSVTFDYNNGSSNVVVSVESDTVVSKPSSPTKTGYTFNYWELNGSEYNFSTLITDNITLVAKYTAKTYTINLDVNGGTELENNTISVTYGQTYELETPQREDFVFLGWYDSNDILFDGGTWSHVVGSSFSLKAKWGESYAIHYYTNGGTNSLSNPTKYFEIDDINLEGATKTGYVFAGWYENADFTGQAITNVNGKSGELILYAKYTSVEYSIKYVLNDGVNSVDNKTNYTIEDTVTLSDASKLGNKFAGWYYSADFSGEKVTSIISGTTGDITLYAKYETNAYKMVFDVAGGTAVTTIFYDFGDYITLPSTSREGYVFIGWYNGEDLFNDGTINIAGDVNLVAKWSEIYYITYRENGGEIDSSNPLTYVSEESCDLFGASRFGYEFAGWYESEDLSGSRITVIEIGREGELILYAKWEALEYNITYHNANGESNVTTYTIEDEVIFTEVSKEHYTFIEWCSDVSLTTPIYRIYIGTTGDIDVYAKWEALEYTITFMIDAEYDSYTTQNYTIDDEIIFDEIDKVGYKFIGWYSNDVFSGSVVTSISSGTTGDKTFYAKFELLEYKISYYMNGELNSESSYTINDQFSTLFFEKTGYEFSGWFYDSEMTSHASSYYPIGTTGDKTFYSTLECIQYSITYYLNVDYDFDNVIYYTVEDEVTLISINKAGFDFIGWTNLDGYSYTTFLPVGTTGNLTFEGICEIITYTITFNVISNDSYSYTREYNVESNFIFWEEGLHGYTFDGWYNNSNYTGDAHSSITEGSTGDKEFYCRFSLNTYSVRYFVNGTEVFTNGASYTVLDSFDLNDYSVANTQSFLGWYTSDEYNLWERITTTNNYAQDFVLYGRVVEGIKDIYLNEYELVDGTLSLIKGSNYNDIDVPEEVNGYKVTSIGSNAFLNCDELSYISIPSIITTIGANAFSGCTMLHNIQFKGETKLNFVDTTAFSGVEELRVDFFVEESDVLKALFPNDAIINFYYDDSTDSEGGIN